MRALALPRPAPLAKAVGGLSELKGKGKAKGKGKERARAKERTPVVDDALTPRPVENSRATWCVNWPYCGSCGR